MQKWHTMTADETVRALSQLSAAGSGESSGENNVFRYRMADFAKEISAAFSDAGFLFFCVAALIFSVLYNDWTAAAQIPVALAGILLSAVLKYRADRNLCLTAEYLIPTARRSSGGRVTRCGSRKLRPGDVILVREGDIVPADARLLSATELVVREEIDDLINAERVRRIFEKHADKVYSDSDEEVSFANMLYAGAEVVSGSGKAVVTDVGGSAKESVLHGGVPMPDTDAKPDAVRRFSASVRRRSTVLLIAVIPAFFLWLLLRQTGQGSGNPTLPEIFFVILTTAVSASPLCLSTLTDCVVGCTAARLSGHAGAAVIRPDELYSLALTDTVLVCDNHLFCDPTAAVRTVFCGGREYSADEFTAAELADFSRLSAALCTAAGMAPEKCMTEPQHEAVRQLGAFLIRRKENVNKSGLSLISAERITADGTEAVEFRIIQNPGAGSTPEKREQAAGSCLFSDDPAFPLRCRTFRQTDRVCVPADNVFLDRVRSCLSAYRKDGKNVCTLATRDENGELILEGIVSIGSYCPAEFAAETERMRTYGIETKIYERKRTVAFPYQKILGDGNVLDMDTFEKSADYPDSLQYAAADNRVFLGGSDTALAATVHALKASGKTVLPIISEVSETPLVSEAGRIGYSAGSGQEALCRVGTVRFLPATDRVRVSGIQSVFSAIRAAGGALFRHALIRDFVLFTGAARCAAVLSAVLLGEADRLSTLIGWVIAGFAADTAVCALLAAKNAEPSSLRSVRAVNLTETRSGRALLLLCALLFGTAAPVTSRFFGGVFFPDGGKTLFFNLSALMITAGVFAAAEFLFVYADQHGRFSAAEGIACAVFAAIPAASLLFGAGLLTAAASLIPMILSGGGFFFAWAVNFRAARKRCDRAEL